MRLWFMSRGKGCRGNERRESEALWGASYITLIYDLRHRPGAVINKGQGRRKCVSPKT